MNTYSFSTQLKQNKITQYCNNNIPIVIFHIGNQDYFKTDIELKNKDSGILSFNTGSLYCANRMALIKQPTPTIATFPSKVLI